MHVLALVVWRGERLGVGEVELTGEALTPGADGLTLILHTAEPHSASPAALDFLPSWSGATAAHDPSPPSTSRWLHPDS